MLEASLATPAPLTTRPTAIVQAAVFDAVNGITPSTPIHVFHISPRTASKRAAAVQAAYATLIRLYPAQLDMFDQQRSASLTAIARGWDAERPESTQRGVKWGQTVADSIWDWRSKDGFAQTPAPPTVHRRNRSWRMAPDGRGHPCQEVSPHSSHT